MPRKTAAWLQRAWELCYLDPLAARELGQQALQTGETHPSDHAWGWLHVALAEARVGNADVAALALAHAREAFDSTRDLTGPLWCDEVQAIMQRRAGDYAASAELQARLTIPCDSLPGALLQFVAHNSRAITAKMQGRVDDALRHFHAASEAARRTGWAGPRIVALGNLGGYHQDLYNLEDARALCEQALAAALKADASHALLTSASNLIVVYHALGAAQRAREMVNFVHTHAHRMVPGAVEQHASYLALGHLSVGEVGQALQHLQAGPVAASADGDGRTLWAWLMARCLLSQGQAAQARDTALQALTPLDEHPASQRPYETMELQRALADACEQLGEHAAALQHLRQAHQRYENLVGRSARARYIALEFAFRLNQVQRERDQAVVSHRSAEDDRQRLAELNAALKAQAAQTELLHAQLREQALRDPLTGLHNRRYLFELAPGLLEMARRQSKPVCVALIDLDHFKDLNDTYGHQAGDAALNRFAMQLRGLSRRSDILCRHGGEEFVAVMTDIDADGAQAMLARLLQAYSNTPDATEPGHAALPTGTFSAGIARFPVHGQTLEQLLARADQALYSAKRQGRARIVQAEGADAEPGA